MFSRSVHKSQQEPRYWEHRANAEDGYNPDEKASGISQICFPGGWELEDLMCLDADNGASDDHRGVEGIWNGGKGFHHPPAGLIQPETKCHHQHQQVCQAGNQTEEHHPFPEAAVLDGFSVHVILSCHTWLLDIDTDIVEFVQNDPLDQGFWAALSSVGGNPYFLRRARA